MYETFEHTADLGIRIRASDLNSLFAEAGEAIFSVLVEDLASVRPSEHRRIEVAGDERDYLLFDWLNQLLYLFETERLLLRKFQVQIDPAGLKAEVWGEPRDDSRHLMSHEVKAITYHGLKVAKEANGWLAEVIVDI